MSANQGLEIRWRATSDPSRELARFFAGNISPDYISHSELQGNRALGVGRWRPDIVDIFDREIENRVSSERGEIAKGAQSNPVLEARLDGRLVGIALVSMFPDAPVPYAVLEDIAVDETSRGQGIGDAVVAWVSDEARRHGCKRVFLESGLGNHKAHEFFERRGFAPCSVVMMKEL